MSMLRMLVVALATVVCTACAHYYKAIRVAGRSSTPRTSNTMDGGAKDAQTGGEVTLQNSEVSKIDEDAYKKGSPASCDPASEIAAVVLMALPA
jgi:uncharacterized protein (UPF0262 family)